MPNYISCLVKSIATATILGIVLTLEGHAKPLVADSQSTFASACIEGSETAQRLVEICQNGLGDVDASDRQRIEMLDRLAWAYFDLGELEKSDNAFSDILDINPNAEPGLQGRAWVFYYRDDFTSASDLFRKAVSRKPTAESLAGLAASNRHSRQVEFDEYEESMRLALALDPEYTWGIRELAWSLTDQSRLDEALKLFRSVTEIDSFDVNAHYGMAFVLSEQERWEDAFQSITRTLELDPESVGAKSRRSLILLMLDRPKQALVDAEAVIQATPDSADGYVRKARALSAMGRRAKAHAVLQTAEVKAGPSSYLLFWRADLLAADYDFDEALVQIRRSVKMEDANHIDHRFHAEIALWMNKTEEARKAIDVALALNPDVAYAQYVNALVVLAEGDFKGAESTFDAAIEAGLSEDYLGDFLSALVGEGRFAQALSMRIRYYTANQG